MVYAAKVSVTFFYLSKYLLVFQARLSLLILYASVICLLVQQSASSWRDGMLQQSLVLQAQHLLCAPGERNAHINQAKKGN